MSDMVLQFSQGIPQGQLSQLGGMGANIIQQQRAARAKAQQEQQYNQAMQQWMQTKDPKALFNLTTMAGNMGRLDPLKKSIEMMDEAQRKQNVRENANILSYIVSGNIDLAVQELDKEIQAANNSGDPKAGEMAQRMKDQLEAGDVDSVETMINVLSSPFPEWRETMENVYAMRDSQIAQSAEERAIVKDAEKLGYSTEKIEELKNYSETMGYDTAKKMLDFAVSAEQGRTGSDPALLAKDMNRDWYQRTRNVNSAIDSYSNVLSLLEKGTGESDYAAIKAFNILLEPGSVVREGEFAMTEQTESVVNEAIKNAENVFSSQGRVRLTEPQRQRFMEAADLLFGTVQDRKEELKAPIDGYINTYNLPAEAVYGSTDGLSSVDRRLIALQEDRKENTAFREYAMKEYPTEAKEIKFLTNQELKEKYAKTYMRFKGGDAGKPATGTGVAMENTAVTQIAPLTTEEESTVEEVDW